jgi:hypothetical protein
MLLTFLAHSGNSYSFLHSTAFQTFRVGQQNPLLWMPQENLDIRHKTAQRTRCRCGAQLNYAVPRVLPSSALISTEAIAYELTLVSQGQLDDAEALTQ